MVKMLIAGNWKMHGTRAELHQVEAIARLPTGGGAVEVALCLPATLIAEAHRCAPELPLGGQDNHHRHAGPHTGCVSAAMLADAGARYVILGHSERRGDQRESDEDVRSKAEAALAVGLVPIICVGESEAERDAGQAVERVTAQLDASLPDAEEPGRLVIAYEPIWAIGTGRTPSTEEVAQMHAALRERLVSRLGEPGRELRILYGGSMNGDNVADLLAVEHVNGGLVGGASLSAAKFAPIVAAAVARASH